MVTVPRGIGLWGDMVITLRDGQKAELRALERFKELKEYILKRRDELREAERPAAPKKAGAAQADKAEGSKGFA